jgi:hypothetical protein
MPRSKTAWKMAEKLTAKELKGTRVLRGADFSKSDVDVIVDDFPSLRIDSKYRQKWAHHKFLTEIKDKYCKTQGDIPVLITKNPKMQGGVVSLFLHDLGILLDAIRELREKRNEPDL